LKIKSFHDCVFTGEIFGEFNTAIGDILADTGPTKGGLYGHFPSKEEIWNAVYDEAVRIWKGIVFKDLPGYGSSVAAASGPLCIRRAADDNFTPAVSTGWFGGHLIYIIHYNKY
jgi:AcrR family transcriptional regulator